ncbi:MAG TPA: MFS transporter [Sphingomicrobium sp.]|jgi:MFS family permease|nr:MFS transporter [Sphingomicrobium sp.]
MATLARKPRIQAVPALVLMLGASVTFNYIDRSAIGVAAPLMTKDLGLSATTFGFAVAAFYWIYAPIQLFLGRLCDRFSVYRLLALGTLLWSVSTLLMGFVAGFLSLFLLRLILGIGESIFFPGSSKIICRHVPPDRRGVANGVIAVALALGPALGTLVGGSLLAAFGWRSMFIIFGLASGAWLLPWQRLVRSLPAESVANEFSFPVRKILGRWSLWAMGIGHALSNYGFYFLLAFLPLYLVNQRGLTIIQMTMVTTLGFAVQAVAALTLGTISDRWTRSGRPEAVLRRWMLSGGQLAAAAAIIGIFLAHDIATVAVLLCVAGVATGSLSLNLYAVAQMFAGPRASGTWVGIQNAVGNTSGIVGPVVSGIIIDQAGYGGAFALTAAITAFGALWWLWGVPRIEQVALD